MVDAPRVVRQPHAEVAEEQRQVRMPITGRCTSDAKAWTARCRDAPILQSVRLRQKITVGAGIVSLTDVRIIERGDARASGKRDTPPGTVAGESQ
jgi:hypothetical protein